MRWIWMQCVGIRSGVRVQRPGVDMRAEACAQVRSNILWVRHARGGLQAYDARAEFGDPVA